MAQQRPAAGTGAGRRAPTIFALALLAGLAVSIAALPARASASPGWEVILDRPTPNFGGVDFVSASEGWMVAGAGLLHTTDGGATWTEATRLSGGDIDFADPDHGWLVGANGSISATVDGGETWATQHSGTFVHLTEVQALSRQEAWAFGRYLGYSDVIVFPVPSALLHTTDGGATWQSIETPPNTSFSEMEFAGSGGWLLGRSCTPPPDTTYCGAAENVVLLRTTDGGTTWALQETDLPAIVRSMTFVDETHGWLSASACTEPTNCIIGVYRTTDGGVTWELGDLGAFGLVWGLAFRDTMTGWAVEQDCTPDTRCSIGTPTTRVMRTDDSGATWRQAGSLRLPSQLQTPFRLELYGSTLYLTGIRVAYRSIDEGATWQQMEQPAVDFDSNLDFVSKTTGYLISGGDLLRSDDAGANWSRVGLVPEGARGLVRFLDDRTGFTPGRECTARDCRMVLWRTRDGGGVWEPVFRATDEDTYALDVQFRDTQHGWAVFSTGAATTSDGGATWTHHTLPQGWSILDFTIADATHLWAIIGLPDLDTTYPTHYEIRQSTDNGQTWQSAGSLAGYSTPVVFVDRAHGWYVEHDCSDVCTSRMFSTRDGGATWQGQDLNFNQFYDLVFVDALNGWVNGGRCDVSGCAYQLQHTADGGETWITQLSGITLNGALEFVDVKNGWFALSPHRGKGTGGGPPIRTVLYRTTDAGGGPIGELPTPPPKIPDVGTGPSDSSPSLLLFALLLASGAIALCAGALIARRRKARL